jgi:hyperosmotically inducible periplasmic protein
MKLLLAILLLSLPLQFGCSPETESTTQAAREPERETDSDLEKTIETKFKSDPDLRDTNVSVDADIDRNWATLSGTVRTEALRTKAAAMVRSARPGLTIDNKIEVKPREMSRSDYTPEMARAEVERARTHKETVGGTLDDAWIHAKIVAQLVEDKDTPERKINVDVEHSVVTLRGTVETVAQKQEAERIAKQTEGVKSVKNRLTLAKS